MVFPDFGIWEFWDFGILDFWDFGIWNLGFGILDLGILDFGILGFPTPLPHRIFGFWDFGFQTPRPPQTPQGLENVEKPLIFVNANKNREVRAVKMPQKSSRVRPHASKNEGKGFWDFRIPGPARAGVARAGPGQGENIQKSLIFLNGKKNREVRAVKTP